MRIIGLNQIRAPKPFKDGSMIEAFFSVELRGIALRDCMLVKNSDGRYFVMPPKAMNNRDAVLDAMDALEGVSDDDGWNGED